MHVLLHVSLGCSGEAVFAEVAVAAEVATLAIKGILHHKELSSHWAVAAYIGSPCRNPYRHGATSQQRRVDDCRPFVRNYFAEITTPSATEGWLWLTKGMWLQKFRTHEETMRVPLRAQASAQPKPPPKAARRNPANLCVAQDPSM